ncbi:MAG: hypothetical protein DPW18_06160 [Chloroflexi bacterium]|nr:hypothetical protein [Chloroflexota bacterium]MDL1941857.1 hypothetical protein [Chloroflexi bacterium CFX2]
MELTLIFQIISTTAVILGIIFGILNLRNFQAMRKREAAILMLNSFQTNDFVRGLLYVLELDHNPGKEEVDGLSPDQHLAFYMLLGTWERLGILVFRREIDIAMVEDAYSGPIMLSWNRLENYVLEIRAAWKRESAFEWFQWLAERVMERDQKIQPPPAYRAHKNWKP